MGLLDIDFATDSGVLKSICLEKVKDRICENHSIRYDIDEDINFEHLVNNPHEYILGRYLDIYNQEYVISVFHRPNFYDDGATGIFGMYHELFYLDPQWDMYNVLNVW
jgi:hypothetical protein